ncbi:MAG: YbjN domain-containing protein [Planctomycetes bacterium]|nr:YbjN domain-containing protein [Planctomycetota bacterium]MBM4058747.1 YbjN domain-containing protein [Planctomycetota bacterium]
MRGEGYAVEMHEAGFVPWKLDGFRCQMFVSDDASALQFHVSFRDGNATLKKANTWDATKRFSRTYLDDEGGPHRELDLDLAGGVATRSSASRQDGGWLMRHHQRPDGTDGLVGRAVDAHDLLPRTG